MCESNSGSSGRAATRGSGRQSPAGGAAASAGARHANTAARAARQLARRGAGAGAAEPDYSESSHGLNAVAAYKRCARKACARSVRVAV